MDRIADHSPRIGSISVVLRTEIRHHDRSYVRILRSSNPFRSSDLVMCSRKVCRAWIGMTVVVYRYRRKCTGHLGRFSGCHNKCMGTWKGVPDSIESVAVTWGGVPSRKESVPGIWKSVLETRRGVPRTVVGAPGTIVCIWMVRSTQQSVILVEFRLQEFIFLLWMFQVGAWQIYGQCESCPKVKRMSYCLLVKVH